MSTTQLPFLVEAILMIVAMIFGFMLKKSGKPYSKLKLGIHIFFFVWLTVGYGFIFVVVIKSMTAIIIPLIVMGLAILTSAISGISMIITKKAGKLLPKIHIISAIVLILGDVCALLFS